jgi:membrane fusion protein, multidrug efflux system
VILVNVFRRPRYSAHVALAVLLPLAALGCGSQAAGEKAGTKPAAAADTSRPAASITLAASDVATVAPATIEDGVALTGDLNPIETVEIHARIEGDLTGVYVREGQQVGAGQLLARFEASEQESARSSAEADRVAAQSELANAQWTLDQNAQLFKAGAIAEQAYKSSQQAVVAARARLAAAEARLRATGNEARDTRVVSPTSGVVSRRLVESGEHVAKGASMFTVVRNNVLELAAAVPARQSNALRVGQVVHFAADGRRFDGTVARLSPTVDPATRAITVYVQIPNPGGVLRGGTFATGRVVSRTLTNVLAVPNGALRQSPEDGKPYVYRIDGRTLNVAPVQIGASDDRLGLVQVTDGLQAGDRVVVGNVGALGRGMQITIAGQEPNVSSTK